MRRYAKQHGKDPDDLLLEIIYSTEEKTRDRLVAMKLLKEHTAVKIAEGGEVDKALAPQFFLPEQRPPELSVIHGGKTE